MTTLLTVLGIIVAIGIAAVTTWINIKIRFAATADQAMKEAKAILWRVVLWSANTFLALDVILALTVLPLDRLGLCTIVIGCCSLIHSFVSFQILQVYKRMIEINKVYGDGMRVFGENIVNLSRQDVELIETISQLEDRINRAGISE